MQNFLKNSMRIYDFSLITESWNLIQAGTDVPKPTTTPQPTAVGDVNNNQSNLTDVISDDAELIPDVDLEGNRSIVNVTAEDTLAERYAQ